MHQTGAVRMLPPRPEGEMPRTPHLIVATGLLREAQIAGDSAVLAIAGGGDGTRLARELERALAQGAAGVVSFGIAGGMAPDLHPGATIIATHVVSVGGSRFGVDATWLARLRALVPEATARGILGSDEAVTTTESKASLYGATGMAAVDMESHIAAAAAARHGVPFAALRVIADDARQSLPPAALAGLHPTGGVDIAAVLRSLISSPGQLPRLLAIARDSGTAFRTLGRVRRRLGLGCGLVDFGDLALDVT